MDEFAADAVLFVLLKNVAAIAIILGTLSLETLVLTSGLNLKSFGSPVYSSINGNSDFAIPLIVSRIIALQSDISRKCLFADVTNLCSISDFVMVDTFVARVIRQIEVYQCIGSVCFYIILKFCIH